MRKEDRTPTFQTPALVCPRGPDQFVRFGFVQEAIRNQYEVLVLDEGGREEIDIDFAVLDADKVLKLSDPIFFRQTINGTAIILEGQFTGAAILLREDQARFVFLIQTTEEQGGQTYAVFPEMIISQAARLATQLEQLFLADNLSE